MTIASAFNEIAVANGGQADTSGTIAGAVDALTDALAGSDVAQGATIEDGVRVLGEYISGGGGSAIGGTIWNWPFIKDAAPTVGDALGNESLLSANSVYLDKEGNKPLVAASDNFSLDNTSKIASGCWIMAPIIKDAYVVTVGVPAGGDMPVYQTVEKINVETVAVPGPFRSCVVKLPEYNITDPDNTRLIFETEAS